jgi:dethiobiotin synthetase
MRRDPGTGCFVTGTDTGVGKTVVGCAIVRTLRARGVDVAVRKPIETGVGPDGPLDARALREAAASREPLDAICPVALPLPAAPSVAAADADHDIALEPLLEGVRAAIASHAFTLVEGAGGLLVPVSAGYTMADLARDLGLPLVVVARARLGTLNHTRLTLEAARARGLHVAGVVVSHVDGPLSDADAKNLAWLRHELGTLVVGEIPPLERGAQPASNAIDVDALLARCR